MAARRSSCTKPFAVAGARPRPGTTCPPCCTRAACSTGRRGRRILDSAYSAPGPVRGARGCRRPPSSSRSRRPASSGRATRNHPARPSHGQWPAAGLAEGAPSVQPRIPSCCSGSPVQSDLQTSRCASLRSRGRGLDCEPGLARPPARTAPPARLGVRSVGRVAPASCCRSAPPWCLAAARARPVPRWLPGSAAGPARPTAGTQRPARRRHGAGIGGPVTETRSGAWSDGELAAAAGVRAGDRRMPPPQTGSAVVAALA
ncbi:hypothetical protein HBB16_08515 [Pseudonocardia sp. MCCB 268]|nr:hypothetical protein [Pseudonocardia cytotoxica]